MKTQLLTLIFVLFTIQTFAFPDSTETRFRNAPFQFTFFIPPIGTNGIYFNETKNDVSINTFIGVGAASNYLELGGFLNYNRLYSNGLQASGYLNVSGFDILAKDMWSNGCQLAGFANINGNNYKGVQAAGFMNMAKSFEGLQVSGFMNVNRSAEKSIHVAGFSNFNKTVNNSFELAGFANISTEGLSILQGAGFLNIAQDLKGVQGSGFANIARDVEGVQGAGFINIARNVKGAQLSGFINICDSIDGIPIGFINIVKKNGYRNLEVSTNEWSHVQLTYRMGVEKFYNIYSISKLPNSWDHFALGFGVGHNRQIFNKTDLNIELVHHQEFKFVPNYFLVTYGRYNALSQLKLGIRRNLFGKVWLNAGPTLNLGYAYKLNGNTQPSTDDFQPYLWKIEPTSYTNYPNWNTRFWVGFHAGISIN
jgi:hypothetical protein